MFRNHTVRLAVAGVLLSLVAPTAWQARAAAADLLPAPTLTPGVVTEGDSVQATGAIPTKVIRPAKLQQRTGDRWQTILTKATTRTGKYRFTFTAPAATTKYRVVAPEARVNGKKYAARTTRAATLQVTPDEPEDPLPPQFERMSRLADGTIVHPALSTLLAMAPDGSAGLWTRRLDGPFRHLDLQLWNRSTGATTDVPDPPQADDEDWFATEASDDLRFVAYTVARSTESGQTQWALKLWDRVTSTLTVIHPFIDDYYEPEVGNFLYTGLYIMDVSADGRYVVYESDLETSKLVLWDRTDGSSEVITDSRPGFQRLNGVRHARISDDGRYVVFHGAGNQANPDAPEWEQGLELARWDAVTEQVTIIPTTLPETWTAMNTIWGGWTDLALMRADGSAVVVMGHDADFRPRWGFLDTATGVVEELTLPAAPSVPDVTVGDLYVSGLSPGGESLVLEARVYRDPATNALFTWQVGAPALTAVAETADRGFGERTWVTADGRQAMFRSPPLFDGVEAMSGLLFWDFDRVP